MEFLGCKINTYSLGSQLNSLSRLVTTRKQSKIKQNETKSFIYKKNFLFVLAEVVR